MKKVLLIATLFFLVSFKHPFYLSVIDLKYNDKDKAVQGSVRLFVSDFEDALKKINKKPVDLINDKDTSHVNKLIKLYLMTHLAMKLNGKEKAFTFVGYERDEEAILAYIEFKNCEAPKKVEIKNSVLFDFLSDQTNIVYVDVDGEKKSSKASNPDKDFVFDF